MQRQQSDVRIVMTGAEHTTQAKPYRLAIALTLVTFAIWGLAHQLYDTLLPDFTKALSLNDYQNSLALWALSFGYYFMALPAALISRNFGYKSGVVFGLGTFSVGMFLFYPAAAQHGFLWLMLAAAVVGSGLAILEVAADPLVVRLGPVETAVRRLNVAQMLNPVGVVAGFFLGQYLLGSGGPHGNSEVAAVLVTPLFLIGAAVLGFAFLVDNVQFPPVAIERVAKDDNTVQSFKPLLANGKFLRGAGALFLCSVAQVVMWGFAAFYALSLVRDMTPERAHEVQLWCLFSFTIGRVAGTGLMVKFNPSTVLAAFAAAGAVAAGVAVFDGGMAGVWGLVVASFFLSVVFPTIFGNSIRDLGAETKTAAAMLMFAAGSGAAVLAVLHVIVTPATVQMVMAVPALCFAAIAVYAVFFRLSDRTV